MGEQENCLINHNADSCLFPIQAGGVYKLPHGPRGAVGVLTELLEKFPGDLRARWLLNIGLDRDNLNWNRRRLGGLACFCHTLYDQTRMATIGDRRLFASLPFTV